MIKPYNTTEPKINKYTSMFNKLPANYEFKNLETQIHIYETEVILNTEFNIKPKKTMKDVFKYLYDEVKQ